MSWVRGSSKSWKWKGPRWRSRRLLNPESSPSISCHLVALDMRRGSEYEEDDNSRLRDWCWTLYPDTVGENKTRTWLEYLELKSRYTVYGIEICPESKKVHFQGYSEFKAPIAKKTLVNLGCGVHLEARRGTREQARDYCTGECDKPKIYPPNIDDPIIEMGIWKEEGIKGTDDWRKGEAIS